MTTQTQRFALILLPAAIAGACAPAATKTTAAAPPAAALSSNPLFVESNLPYHAPRFDVIRNEDYQPALDEGIRQWLGEVDSIAKQTAPPTFDNTIAAM